MTDAAMQAQYTHLDFVPTRKVVKIILEIPIEQADAFIAAFGSPRPDKSVAVAVARLDTRAIAEKPKGGKLAQRAGIVCDEGAFQHFMASRNCETAEANKELTVDYLRIECGIASRAELDHNPEAAKRFNDLMREYQAWRTHG